MLQKSLARLSSGSKIVNPADGTVIARVAEAGPQVVEAAVAAARQALRGEWVRFGVRQRAALLLNLREPNGQGVIELFPLTGVATFPQIAAALEFSLEQLAELWNSLPIDDERIADLLHMNRQQVINLRKAARARLGRRMRENIAEIR